MYSVNTFTVEDIKTLEAILQENPKLLDMVNSYLTENSKDKIPRKLMDELKKSHQKHRAKTSGNYNIENVKSNIQDDIYKKNKFGSFDSIIFEENESEEFSNSNSNAFVNELKAKEKIVAFFKKNGNEFNSIDSMDNLEENDASQDPETSIINTLNIENKYALNPFTKDDTTDPETKLTGFEIKQNFNQSIDFSQVKE